MQPIESEAARILLKHAIAKTNVAFGNSYTNPRTWGVYEIEPLESNRTTRRFRIGNHPVRQRELETEFGKAKCIAIFLNRILALELQVILNGRQVSP